MANLHGVFKAALNGIHERGNGGFVYVKGDMCAYTFPREFRGSTQMTETMEELLADEKAARVFTSWRSATVRCILAYPGGGFAGSGDPEAESPSTSCPPSRTSRPSDVFVDASRKQWRGTCTGYGRGHVTTLERPCVPRAGCGSTMGSWSGVRDGPAIGVPGPLCASSPGFGRGGRRSSSSGRSSTTPAGVGRSGRDGRR